MRRKGKFQTWQKSHACQIRHLVFHISNGLAFAVLCAVLSWSDAFDSLQPMDWSLPGSSVHGDSPGRNTGASYHALLQGIFPTQGSNPGLPHCRWILYHLSHQGSPWILEWVDYLFSRDPSQCRNRTRVTCTADGFFFFFTNWATTEAWVCHI